MDYFSEEPAGARETPIDVFFDDFKVTQTHSPVVQKSDYQAFGLEFNSYSRAAITAQNFKFNAGSEQEQMTDWYSTPFRKYDPSLGRFHGVDALADLYSSTTPSHFGMNNPINYNDPTGLTVAPKSENQKQGAGGGTQHRHTPDALGVNNRSYSGWTSLYDATFGSPDRYALVYVMNRINNNSGGLTFELMNAFINVALNHKNGGSYSKTTGFTFFDDGATGQSQMEIAAFEAGEASGGLQGALVSFASMGSYTGADSNDTKVLNNVDLTPNSYSVGGSIFDREPDSNIIGFGDIERAVFWAGEGDISRTILYGALGASDLLGLAAIGKSMARSGFRVAFKGLAQNRSLRSLTHNELYKAFLENGYKLSGHEVNRLKSVRTQNLGFETLNDIRQIFNKGTLFDAGNGALGRSYNGMEVIYNTIDNVIVTFRPAKRVR